MRVAAALLCLLAAAFAGCVASDDGLSAMGAVERADPVASDWAEDAILTSVVGSEAKGLDASLAGDLGIGAEALNDTSVGDGFAPVWYVSYFSPASGKRLVLAVTDSDVTTNADAPSPGLEEDAAQAKTNRDAWTVDSDAAIETARANGTVDGAINDAAKASLLYGYDLARGSWSVYVNTDTMRIQAIVEGATGEIGPVQALNGSGLVPPPPPALPPAPIHKEAETQASLDPLNVAMMPPCSTPTHACDETPFTLNGTFDIEATLTWTLPANDFDFYVMEGDNTIVLMGASDVTSAGSTTETISGSLGAGDYKLVVVPWSAAADSFTLDATFS